MSIDNGYIKQLAKLGLLLMLGASLSACAGLGGTSWKEQVLLNDGSKIIVRRSQSYGGRHEIGQSIPVSEHTISFDLPGSGKKLSWTSEFGEDIGRTNFNLLALHILNGTAYLVAEPNLCLSYNKWGRPNPPYVIFRNDGREWQRIPISELPAEFKSINLIVNNGRTKDIEWASAKLGYVPSDEVMDFNSSLSQPEYRTILREPLVNYGKNCGEMISNGKGAWIGIGWFRDQPSYEACMNYCGVEKIDAQRCPCTTLFKGTK
jgi:hypothetical protein